MIIRNRLLDQKIDWLDVEKQIYDEDTILTNTYLGLFKFKRQTKVKHHMPKGSARRPIGLRSKDEDDE